MERPQRKAQMNLNSRALIKTKGRRKSNFFSIEVFKKKNYKRQIVQIQKQPNINELNVDQKSRKNTSKFILNQIQSTEKSYIGFNFILILLLFTDFASSYCTFLQNLSVKRIVYRKNTYNGHKKKNWFVFL